MGCGKNSKGEYESIIGTVYKIPDCSPNKFNVVYPYAMFGVFWTSFLIGAIPLIIFGKPLRILQNIWMIVIPFILSNFKHFIPSEVKLFQNDALIKMSALCYIVPFIKLSNARYRIPTEEDFVKCKWPTCRLSSHNRGMSWSTSTDSRNDCGIESTNARHGDFICVEGEYKFLFLTYRNMMIIVPSFASIEELQV